MPARPNEIIEIHQALHGYSEGHCLLETSRSWPRETERALLVLSDMSGPRMLPGFESYFTGYPLPGVGVYAFAKTWYAPEMDRPGCVWTHTLLIENADLARITNLQELIELFRRPQKGQSWSAYRSPLTFSFALPSGDWRALNEISSSAAINTLIALYGFPDKPVYIPTDSSDCHAALVLAVWSQQWPRLRRSFQFCTGALANRTINSQIFDLQVFPSILLRSFNREVHNAQFVRFDTVQDSIDLPLWVKVLEEDLFTEKQKPLRQFLWEFGADIAEGRSAFPRLVETFVLLNDQQRPHLLSSLTDLISRYFPKAEDATRLKMAIFGGFVNRKHWLLPRVTEIDLLQELITTKHYEAFDVKALNCESRAKILWETEREAARHFILESSETDLNPLGEAFFAGISEAINGAEALEFLKFQPRVLQILIRHNLSLATSLELWQGSLDEQRRLLEIITVCQNIPLATSKSIVGAMLTSGVEMLAEQVVKQLGPQTIDAILEWFDTSTLRTPDELGRNWRQVLTSQPSALLGWLSEVNNPRDITVALVACLLDPHSPEVQRFGVEVWLRFLPMELDRFDRRTLIKTMAFFLALSFNNPGTRAEELIAYAFATIHEAAENDELDYDSWMLLRDQLPSLSWWSNWDRCERLRRTLIERFIRYEWSVEQFLRSTEYEELFQKIIESCKATTSGRNFLREIARLVAHGKIHITDVQRSMLTSFV